MPTFWPRVIISIQINNILVLRLSGYEPFQERTFDAWIIPSVMALFLQYKITIMQLSLKEQSPPSKMPRLTTQPPHNYGFHPRFPTEEIELEEGFEDHSEDEKFSLSVTSRNEEPGARVIRKSMVNRSCINTCNFSCRNLSDIPPEIRESTPSRLAGIQKIDLSFNNITSLAGVAFEGLVSLKELMVNDNQLLEVHHHTLNFCRQLRLVNLTNNQLTILPPLTAPSFILARGNPFKLITALLVKLTQLEFVTLDWLQYLLDAVTNELSNDRFKDYTKDYIQFKRTILENVDYSKQDNCSYCDFNCLFAVRMEQWRGRKEGQEGMIAMQAARAILRGDSFFLNYLRNFHNEVNYAALTYNSRLLLEIALETGRPQALDLFKLRKNNYATVVDEEVYFASLRACCRYSNYDIFKYLIHIRSRKRILQTQAHIAILAKEVIEKYNKEQQSDKILLQLMRFWKDATKGKLVIKLPVHFSHKLFKSISSAILDIYEQSNLTEHFQFQSQSQKTTTLHFAMRSRNEQLIKRLLQEDQDVFQKNYLGQSCKFVQGSTQISRKMVWRREKQMIKEFWKQPETVSEFQPGKQRSALSSARSKLSLETVNNLVQSRIGYECLQSQFLLYRKPIEQKLSFKARTFQIQDRSKHWKDQEILPHIRSSIRTIADLTWQKNYLKKIIHTDVGMFLLGQVENWRENDFMVKLQRWNKAYGQLSDLFELVNDEEDCLIKYELMQTMFRLTGIDSGNNDRVLQGGNFWCCQNVVYE